MDREIVEIIGFFAAGMTVTAFYCTTMLTLRIAAIFANLLFIIYGSGLDLKPVLALHCILLPLNIMRLFKVMRERRRDLPLNIMRLFKVMRERRRDLPRNASTSGT